MGSAVVTGPRRAVNGAFLLRDLYGYLTLGNDVKYGCSSFLFHFPPCSVSWADSGQSMMFGLVYGSSRKPTVVTVLWLSFGIMLNEPPCNLYCGVYA